MKEMADRDEWLGRDTTQMLTTAAGTAVVYFAADRLMRGACSAILSHTSSTKVARDAPDVIAGVAKTLGILHTVVLSYTGWRIMNECRHDIILAQSSKLPWCSGISVGYFASDTVTMYRNYLWNAPVIFSGVASGVAPTRSLASFWKSHWLLVLHHVALITVFIPVPVVTGKGHYLAARIMLAEGSTFFLLLRWFIQKAGWKGTKLDACNSIALLLSWGFTRIWVFPSMYREFAESRGLPVAEAARLLHWHCHLGNATVLLPQLYWFSIMLGTLRKVVAKAFKPKGS